MRNALMSFALPQFKHHLTTNLKKKQEKRRKTQKVAQLWARKFQERTFLP